MAELKGHWTNRDVDDFLYRIGFDFVSQLENMMGDDKTTRASLAKTLGVSKGRVSQVFNNPGNLTLKKVVEYARALGRKVSIVAYDDGDRDNNNGPINSQVFTACWRGAGQPSDLFDFQAADVTAVASTSSDRHEYALWSNSAINQPSDLSVDELGELEFGAASSSVKRMKLDYGVPANG